jgi:hypothetical protein
MNINTLDHLNELRSMAKPVTYSPMDQTIDGPIPRVLWNELLAIEQSKTDEAIRQIIITAARTKQHGNSDMIDWATPDYAGYMTHGIPWSSTALRWTLALPQILAAIEAHNQKTLAAYEVYRVACEQGIAVPPKK